jgi:hypothetical protein
VTLRRDHRKPSPRLAARPARQVLALLKEAIGSSAASPALWGALGRYYRLVGELESSKEALLKQVGPPAAAAAG